MKKFCGIFLDANAMASPHFLMTKNGVRIFLMGPSVQDYWPEE
jgi:hypothetical protein